MFNFEHKEYLLLLFILPVLIGLNLLYKYRRKRDIKKIGDPDIVAGLMPDYSTVRNNLKFYLLLLSVALLIIAIAGPRFG